MSCMGRVENEVMLLTAYFTSAFVDHLETPASRSCTSKGTTAVRNPIQEERARKKALLSRMFSSTFTALRSSSLKSDALDISNPTAALMME